MCADPARDPRRPTRFSDPGTPLAVALRPEGPPMTFRRFVLFLALPAVVTFGCHSQATPPPTSSTTSSSTTSSAARQDAFRAAAAQLSRDTNAPKDSIAGVSQDEM